MNTRAQLICAHSALVWSIVLAAGLFFMTGWLPPFSPGLSPEEIKAVFTDNVQLRIGLAIGAFTAPFFILLFAAMRIQLQRIEGPNGVWGNLNFAAAAIGVLAIQFPAFFWLGISYRPELSPDVVAVLNDVSWFLLLGATGPAILQNVSIGVCILSGDRDQTVFPRWLGYWNLWLAFALVPGVIIPFVKGGPFAWNGLFGFWVVATGFFVWVILNYVYTVKAINQQRDDQESDRA